MVLNFSGLRHLALCCFQTNILPNWLVTSTVQCIFLQHKMSGYRGMISDILMVCGFLISLLSSSIEMILQIQPIYCVDELFKSSIRGGVCVDYDYDYH